MLKKRILLLLLAACASYGLALADTHDDVRLHAAAQDGNLAEVEWLLAAGADVNKDSDGITPLLIAAHKGHREVVEVLLAANADVNKQDEDSDTPLDLAVEEGHEEVATLLRKAMER